MGTAIRRDHVVNRVNGNPHPFALHFYFVVVVNHSTLGVFGPELQVPRTGQCAIDYRVCPDTKSQATSTVSITPTHPDYKTLDTGQSLTAEGANTHLHSKQQPGIKKKVGSNHRRKSESALSSSTSQSRKKRGG